MPNAGSFQEYEYNEDWKDEMYIRYGYTYED